ncbi:ribosomal L1 domain-containing protein CG13096 [Uranotaenia lowii]|uniref:ribosomal L1 domain-containing protein CG13096 n=1 Tax=Uranotaenia lowii TaxID=190385 RepID=UPI00247896CB|nr:ribosomal L1 domain-containing protein CG13096 [Uranotaenia lowii]
MNSNFGRTFLFLTNLAWKSRVTLPVLITAGFMILNFRWEVEINIHTERIAIPRDGRGGPGAGMEGGGRNVAFNYHHDDAWESTDSDEDDDDDEDDEDDDEETDYDEEDMNEGEIFTMNL